MNARADVLVVLAEDWLRMKARDGTTPGEAVRRTLAAVALAAPRAAAICPHLLRFTRVGAQVNALVRALDASDRSTQTPDRAQWMTAAQAARALGVKPDSVRWLLRQGVLVGERTERGWRVDARSVERRQRGSVRQPTQGAA